jgi:hypothetical protein
MFERRVKDYLDRNECTLANAVKAMAGKFPNEHWEYVERLQSGKAKTFSQLGFKVKKGTFEKAVKAHMQKHGTSQLEAMNMAANRYPDAYAEFCFRVESRPAAAGAKAENQEGKTSDPLPNGRYRQGQDGKLHLVSRAGRSRR